MSILINILLSVVVSTTLDSTMLMIGDQCKMHIEAVCEPGEKVQMPVYGEYVVPCIDIVRRTQYDTTKVDGGRIRIHQDLTITSITDSLFYIPGQPFVLGSGDTMYSEGMSLNVIQPFELDTTLAVTDIKPVTKAPIWYWGIIRWVLLGLGILLLIGLGLWLAHYLRRYFVNDEMVPAAEPERPAEEVALEKLDLIKEEKVWQQGRTKEYHTELTDVIREYIGRRYDIHSTEKTSDETLRAMRPEMAEQKELYSRLEKMLRLADLVKFAKWTTTPDENESSLRTAYDFVHETSLNSEAINSEVITSKAIN